MALQFNRFSVSALTVGDHLLDHAEVLQPRVRLELLADAVTLLKGGEGGMSASPRGVMSEDTRRKRKSGGSRRDSNLHSRKTRDWTATFG